MYHCHLHICMIGAEPGLWGPVREIVLPERYTCSFSESETPDGAALSGAGLVLADLRALDAVSAARALLAQKPACADLILLLRPEQADALFAQENALGGLCDVWLPPFTESAMRFRFGQWRGRFLARVAAHETNHFFESTINQTPSLIWYKDKNGIHEKVNNSFCRSVGKTKEQVEGQGHAYIWDVEEEDPACVESERVVMETRQTHVSEERIETGAGPRLLATYKSPLYDLDGSVMGTVDVAIDVTRERAYEKELLQKNKTLETIFTTLDCGVLCHTLDGQVLSINQAALDILGYASQEELQAGFDMVAGSVLEEDKEPLRSAIRRLVRVNDSVSVEYRVQHGDGEILHITGSVKLLEENGVRFYQRFLLDCTEQKQQEDRERRETERTERYHRELIQALSIDYSLVCVYDLDTGAGSLLRLHECSEGVLGSLFSDKIPIQQSFEAYVDRCVYADDREMLRKAFSPEELARRLEGGEAFYLTYRTFCGGRIRYFEMKAVRAGRWDKVRTMVLGLRCVDEETHREMEKKALLEDALARAERASAAKSTFLSNMSHDIRTPMNAIIGFTTLAAAHPERTEQVEDYLGKIMTSGRHLLNLINDVLDMSHIESGKILLDEKPCTLPELVHGLRSILLLDARTKGLELHFAAENVRNDLVECDRLRMNQVLLNLLSNAVKYTPEGGRISLTLTQLPGPDAGTAVYEFRIRDNGIGMSEEFIAHIFEPFEREQNSTISGIQGTGLGMAITKSLVEMMHGEITIQSRRGEGTLAVVRFPLRLCRTGRVLPAELAGTPVLLLAEAPEPMAALLTELELRPVCAADAGQLSALLRAADEEAPGKTPWLACLIDWAMPQAAALAETLHESRPELPLIAVSEDDWAEIENAARAAGVSGCCTAPLFLSGLEETLAGLAAGPQEGQALAAFEPKLRSGRILLAEDNLLNQEIAVAILEEEGFAVEVANNGQEAVEMVRRSAPGWYRLVLMDIQMPVMDGYHAAEAIRALPDKALAGLPILAMTANAFEEDKQQALRHGMDGHIAKPVDVAVLLDALDRVTGQRTE